MNIPTRFWGIGIGSAILLHMAVVAAMFWQGPEPGARRAGTGGVEVSLGPAGGSPAFAADAEVANVDTVEPAPAASEPAPEETATVESDVPVEQRVDTIPEPPARPEPVEAAPSPETESEIEKTASDPVTVDSTIERTSAASGVVGRAGTQGAANTGSADNSSGGGEPGASPDYMTRLRAWLERHKRYPKRAQRLRQEGTALLYFVMDRDGRILEYDVRESSGYEVLDREVAAMIERAQPLPKFPDDMSGPRLELIVPIQFFLL